MRTSAPRAAAAAALLVVFVHAPAAKAPGSAGDPEAAARQYRVARRLAAERSPEAAGALEKVVELDPSGPLADDALLDQALLLGLPEWPEEGGRIAGAARERGVDLLSRAAAASPGADREAEARYRKALLLLEPSSGRDAGGARAELLVVANAQGDDEFPARARHAIAWLDEAERQAERARDAHQRVAIDFPGSEAGRRSRVSLARMLVREGRPGLAAALAQEVVDSGSRPVPDAEAVRDLAAREALRSAGAGGSWSGEGPAVVPTGLRGPTAMARLRSGGVLLADRRSATIVRVEVDGSKGAPIQLDDVQALAEDVYGRVFVAAGEKIYRIDASGPSAVASLGDYAPASAIWPEVSGAVLVLDRRGERVGRVGPSGAGGAPILVASASKGARLASLAWDGARVLSVDTRGRRLVEIATDGSLRSVAALADLGRPSSAVANRCGEVAVLDEEDGEVVLLDASGEIRDRFLPAGRGKGGAELHALGPDGSLDVLVDGGASLVRIP